MIVKSRGFFICITGLRRKEENAENICLHTDFISYFIFKNVKENLYYEKSSRNSK